METIRKKAKLFVQPKIHINNYRCFTTILHLMVYSMLQLNQTLETFNNMFKHTYTYCVCTHINFWKYIFKKLETDIHFLTPTSQNITWNLDPLHLHLQVHKKLLFLNTLFKTMSIFCPHQINKYLYRLFLTFKTWVLSFWVFCKLQVSKSQYFSNMNSNCSKLFDSGS